MYMVLVQLKTKPVDLYIIHVAIVHLNFRPRSTIPVTVCTVPSSLDRTSRCNKVDAVCLRIQAVGIKAMLQD